jgi:hypothetical protein
MAMPVNKAVRPNGVSIVAASEGREQMGMVYLLRGGVAGRFVPGWR